MTSDAGTRGGTREMVIGGRERHAGRRFSGGGHLYPIASLLLALGFWQACVSLFALPGYLLPAPAVVLKELAVRPGFLLHHTWITTLETLRGFEHAFNNPDEAIRIFKSRSANTQPDDQHRWILDYYRAQVHTAATKDRSVGWMATEDWDVMNANLEKYGGMQGRKPPQGYFTNDLLPKN